MVYRRVFLASAAFLLLPLILVAVAIAVLQSDWAERWVEKRVSERLGRAVEIEGVDVDLGWPPAIKLERLRIGNPAWAKTPDLVDAHGLHARLDVLPLFERKLVMPFLSARKATAGLEVDGPRATWRFGEDDGVESPFVIGRVDIDDGHVTYRDEQEQTALAIEAKGSTGPGGALVLSATGRFRGEPTRATAQVPALDPTPSTPIRIAGKATIGRSEIAVDGTFATSFDTIDMNLKLAGPTLRDLHKVTGAEFPDTPSYRLDGHLRHAGVEWILDPFEGKVGNSDLAGSVTYRKGGVRPVFVAKLHSRKLDLDDLGAILGMPSRTGPGRTATTAQRKEAAARAARTEVVPDRRIDTARWISIDMDVTLDAKRVIRPAWVPIDALASRAVLKEGALRLDPLSFAVAGGRVKGVVTIDARQKPLRGELDLDVQGLKLERMFPKAATMQQSFGTMYGRAKLAGRGESLSAILGASDGTLGLAIDGGRVSLLMVEVLGLDLAEALTLLGTRNRQVTLRCAVADFAVQKGVVTPRTFVIDTTDTVVSVDGSARLAQEQLDFVFHPEPKDASIFVLRSPIQLQGSFKDPAVKPKVGPIIARVGAAALLAAVNPLLAILPFVETGPGQDTNCGALIAQVRAKGVVKKTQ